MSDRLRLLKTVFEVDALITQAATQLESLWRTLYERGREKEGIELLHVASVIREAGLSMLARDSVIEASAAFLEGKIPEEQFEDIFSRWREKMCAKCDGKRSIRDAGGLKPCDCADGPVGRCSTDPAFKGPG